MKIKVCLPHYFSKKAQSDYNLPGDWIPGSARGTIEKRNDSFSRCLWSLTHLSKKNNYSLLDIRSNIFFKLEEIINTHDISITVFTDLENYCDEVLDKYKNYIEVKQVDIEDSKNLIFEAREYLLSQEGYDLYLYCEDDIGFISDGYFEKIKWFAEETEQKSVLMPHRYENPHSPDIEKLYIDGPIDQNLLKKFMIPKFNSLTLKYKNKDITFNKPMNPHSATFCITDDQRLYINRKGISRRNDFVSQFESVCTLSVMEFFNIYKPNWENRTFLEVEHYYTNYC